MPTLTDLDTGCWLVTSGSGSTHLFDLGADGSSTVTRLARQAPQATDRDLIADLRRDAEAVPLVGIRRMAVGQDGIFVIRIRADGVVTVRTTTIVLSIEKAS